MMPAVFKLNWQQKQLASMVRCSPVYPLVCVFWSMRKRFHARFHSERKITIFCFFQKASVCSKGSIGPHWKRKKTEGELNRRWFLIIRHLKRVQIVTLQECRASGRKISGTNIWRKYQMSSIRWRAEWLPSFRCQLFWNYPKVRWSVKGWWWMGSLALETSRTRILRKVN